MADLIAQSVAFLIILFVLWRYVLPLIGRMVRDRQDAVQHQVDEAQAATRKLEEAEAKLDASVEQARQEGSRIRDDARAEATTIREELVAQAEAEVARIKQRGQEQLAAQRDQVVRGLRAEVSGTSMQVAERVVREHLTDEAARSATVDGFLSEIENLPHRSGAAVGGTK